MSARTPFLLEFGNLLVRVQGWTAATHPDEPHVQAVEDAAGCHFYRYLYSQAEATGDPWYWDAVWFINNRPVAIRNLATGEVRDIKRGSRSHE